jgi:RNA polymerase sigma-70 factor (ECF subfamily)
VTPDPSTNLSLLHRAQANDQRAWEHLVHLYGPLIQRWCKQTGLQDTDASDIFQETFRAVARQLPGFSPRREEGSFRCWLKSIVRYKIIDHVRRAAGQPAAQGGSQAQQMLGEIEDSLLEESAQDVENERSLLVHRAMEMIRSDFSDQNWRAFQRVAVAGESAADVAAELGMQPAAVRQANYRIRRRLRLLLKDLVED